MTFNIINIKHIKKSNLTMNGVYYPYFLHFLNIFSFRNYNMLPSDVTTRVPPTRQVVLWSITHIRSPKRLTTYEAKYNYYTQNYEFLGERYLSYDDVVKRALQL
jgi:hypothetical protein